MHKMYSIPIGNFVFVPIPIHIDAEACGHFKSGSSAAKLHTYAPAVEKTIKAICVVTSVKSDTLTMPALPSGFYLVKYPEITCIVDSQTRTLFLSVKLGPAIFRCFRHSWCSDTAMLGPYMAFNTALLFGTDLGNDPWL